MVVRTSSGLLRTSPDFVRTSKLTHFSIFATSLTFDLEGVEYIPGNLVYLYYFVADSDIHIECESMDIFSADNPTENTFWPLEFFQTHLVYFYEFSLKLDNFAVTLKKTRG